MQTYVNDIGFNCKANQNKIAYKNTLAVLLYSSSVTPKSLTSNLNLLDMLFSLLSLYKFHPNPKRIEHTIEIETNTTEMKVDNASA